MIEGNIIEIKTDYISTHTDDDCDKCQTKVGKQNLFKVPFIYKEYNDKDHPDILGYDGYKQYYVCIKCYKEILLTLR